MIFLWADGLADDVPHSPPTLSTFEPCSSDSDIDVSYFAKEALQSYLKV